MKDHSLRELALREEFVFVTNNAGDFRKLMGEAELHPGLIVILPNVKPAAQGNPDEEYGKQNKRILWDHAGNRGHNL